MRVKFLTAAIAALAWAVPAAAQQRGTMELGAFGSVASFDQALSLKTAFGGGGRIGMFFDPRWAVEFEKGEMRATRPNGLKNVNVGVVSGRLMAVPFKAGAFAFLLGAGGGVSTETNFLHSYGFDALAGARIAMGDNAALRVDGVFDWLANEKWKSYQTVRVGVSLYRHPASVTRPVAANTPNRDRMMAARTDSLSEEVVRLRARDTALMPAPDVIKRP